MAVPKKRHSKSKVNRRRQHLFLKAPKLNTCSQCQRSVLPHVVCGFCGFYNGKKAINIPVKIKKNSSKNSNTETKK